jgi:8-oxo-dGTP pyrophosphatase MutT (NUDIX family)
MAQETDLSGVVQTERPRSQFGALCWRTHRGQVEVLLITSRDTGRWVIPKGWPMADLPPCDAAAQEAWEEAGVRGKVAAQAFGHYGYDKVLKPGLSRPCDVAVYPLRVERLEEDFPEIKERRRKWFAAAKAARKVAEPELRAIFETLADDPSILIGDKKAAAPAPARTDVPERKGKAAASAAIGGR